MKEEGRRKKEEVTLPCPPQGGKFKEEGRRKKEEGRQKTDITFVWIEEIRKRQCRVPTILFWVGKRHCRLLYLDLSPHSLHSNRNFSQLNPIVFNHWISQKLVTNAIELFARLRLNRSSQRHFHVLPDSHALNIVVSHVLQTRLYGSARRV